LSLPGVTIEVHRQNSVFVQGFEANGKPCKRVTTGLAARVVWHEIDHLNEILILDHGTAGSLDDQSKGI